MGKIDLGFLAFLTYLGRLPALEKKKSMGHELIFPPNGA